MTPTVLSIDAIVSDPAIRGGRPSIAGRTVTVADLVARYLRWGATPEELAAQFKLTLGQVHAALAYYYLHKSALDEDIRRDQDLADRLQAELAEQGKLGRLNTCAGHSADKVRRDSAERA